LANSDVLFGDGGKDNRRHEQTIKGMRRRNEWWADSLRSSTFSLGPVRSNVIRQGVTVMASRDRDLEELQRRLVRLELLLASVEFDKSIWGRVLRLLGVAVISVVVVFACDALGIRQ
jgi:hypothetical protein